MLEYFFVMFLFPIEFVFPNEHAFFNNIFTNENMKFEVAEPKEWLDYVIKGDLKPKTPVWISSSSGRSHKQNNHKNEKIELGEKRLSRKEQSHLDFIQAGKKRR